MKNNKLLGIMFLTVLMTSCDCVVNYRGFVIDSQIEKPIEGAKVFFNKREYKTDSSGFFEIHYITGFCPDPDFQIEKENYKPEKIMVEYGNDEIIYRVKSNSNNNG
jgi:hypothetical protein